MKPSAISWNTGRWYTDAGQRMAAARMPSGPVMFVDVDRGIDGIIPAVGKVSVTQEWVMSQYDHNNYSGVGYSGEERELRSELVKVAGEVLRA